MFLGVRRDNECGWNRVKKVEDGIKIRVQIFEVILLG